VVEAFRLFKENFPTPRALANSTETDILAVIRPLGLHWRARFLRLLGVALSEHGDVPSEMPDLLSLPGVGPYGAAAYLSFHRNVRGVILDSNIVRFYGRLLGFSTGPETRRSRAFREIAEIATPLSGFRAFNYALLDFTRSICTPRPRCSECPLRRRCEFVRQGR
jgi:A/G-specific adenine glycosylase